MPDPTTIFVTTIGDHVNFEDCLDHLRAQTVSRRIEIIERIAPMSAAFDQMRLRCRTPYYVQVDEDMQLFPPAIETLERRIQAQAENVAMTCAPLWDCETSQPVYGVKIFRHSIVKQFPHRDVMASESDQLARIQAEGFALDLLALDRGVCLGEHGKHYTPATIFRCWQRLLEKQLNCGQREWVEAWPQRLLERYAESRNPVHLYALLGAVAGIVDADFASGEFDFTKPNPALERFRRFFPLQP